MQPTDICIIINGDIQLYDDVLQAILKAKQNNSMNLCIFNDEV